MITRVIDLAGDRSMPASPDTGVSPPNLHLNTGENGLATRLRNAVEEAGTSPSPPTAATPSSMLRLRNLVNLATGHALNRPGVSGELQA